MRILIVNHEIGEAICMQKGQGETSSELLLALCSDQWSNAACCGYAMMACQALGYTKKETAHFLVALEAAFENYEVASAERKYYIP